MKRIKITIALILTLSAMTLAVEVKAETSAERVEAIQKALGEARLDGWLFYDFRMSDPLAYRILKLDQQGITTRRWFYYIPARGEPIKIVHSIERDKLDQLPGRKIIYRRWQELQNNLREVLTGEKGARRKHATPPRSIAMQYSPENSIPYVARVDAGTIELIRSFGVTPLSSADLVQRFEAVWTPEQKQMHTAAAGKIHDIILEAFAEIARRIRANESFTEYDIQQFMVRRFEEEELTSDGEPPIVAVNASSANPHYEPTRARAAPIERGSFVLFDVWAKQKKPGAVYADQTWTGYVGETVPEEHARIFRLVRNARDGAVEFIRGRVRAKKPVRAAEVDQVARGLIERAGFGEQFTHRTGHSIGQEVHGNGANIDNLETRDSRRIIPRTCFSIEPGIYLEGRFGVRSEINVYVAEGDIEVTGQPVQTEVVPILSRQKAESSRQSKMFYQLAVY